jgi:hypothetical protein
VVKFTPQLRIWIDVRVLCSSLGYDVYDYLPGDVNYPFVFIGNSFKQDERIQKDYLNGQTQVVVHVWHDDYKKRGTLSTMLGAIETAVRGKYKHDLAEANTQVIADNSTGADLLHGIIEFNIKY